MKTYHFCVLSSFLVLLILTRAWGIAFEFDPQNSHSGLTIHNSVYAGPVTDNKSIENFTEPFFTQYLTCEADSPNSNAYAHQTIGFRCVCSYDAGEPDWEGWWPPGWPWDLDLSLVIALDANAESQGYGEPAQFFSYLLAGAHLYWNLMPNEPNECIGMPVEVRVWADYFLTDISSISHTGPQGITKVCFNDCATGTFYAYWDSNGDHFNTEPPYWPVLNHSGHKLIMPLGRSLDIEYEYQRNNVSWTWISWWYHPLVPTDLYIAAKASPYSLLIALDKKYLQDNNLLSQIETREVNETQIEPSFVTGAPADGSTQLILAFGLEDIYGDEHSVPADTENPTVVRLSILSEDGKDNGSLIYVDNDNDGYTDTARIKEGIFTQTWRAPAQFDSVEGSANTAESRQIPIQIEIDLNGDGSYDYIFIQHINLTRPQPLVVSFLDKADLSRQVTGAAADGASKVVIQITGLPEDITLDDIQISIPEGEVDGSLENDKQISNRVFTQTYIVPTCFARDGHPDDLTNSEREMNLNITVQGEQADHEPFILIRPPVIMVHGIWGGGYDFAGLLTKLSQSGWEKKFLFAVNYNNVLSFSNPEVQQILRDYISNTQKLLNNAHIAKSKVDIVAHSMGGLVAKFDRTFAQKNVRKIITVGTPYRGSPVADKVWAKNGTWLFGRLEYICNKYVSYNQHSFTSGGLESLLVENLAGCPVYTQIPSVDCGHIMAGLRDGSMGKGLLEFLIQLRLLTGMWLASEQDVHNEIFGEGTESDWLVSLSSQQGDAPFIDSIVSVSWHSVEPKDSHFQQLVIDALNQPAQIDQGGEGLTFTGNQDISPQRPNEVLLFEKTPLNQTTMSNSNEPNGTVTILSPTSGQTCTGGEQITISVEGSGTTTATAIFAFFGTSSWADIVQLPWAGDVDIPPDSIGSAAEICAIGLDADMNMTSEDQVGLILDSDIILEEIFFGFGSKWYFDFIEFPEQSHHFQLYPLGKFSDGSVHPLLVLGSQTAYQSLNECVATVDPNGIITVHSKGQGSILVANSSITTTVLIEVDIYSGDLDLDGDVDFVDFALFANQWQKESCIDLDGSSGLDTSDLALLSQNWLKGVVIPIPGDLNRDKQVDFYDFAVLANQWMAGNCAEPAWCEGADLDKSGSVDLYDLGEFAEYWLEGK